MLHLIINSLGQLAYVLEEREEGGWHSKVVLTQIIAASHWQVLEVGVQQWLLACAGQLADAGDGGWG